MSNRALRTLKAISERRKVGIDPQVGTNLRPGEATVLRAAVALVVFGLCSAVVGQVSTFADVKSNGGIQLSAAQLNELLPGAKVISKTQAGSTRTWQNKTDGTLSASTNGRGVSGGRNAYATGEGTWKVGDDGRWCVKIGWPRNPDDWCRIMFKVGDKYYAVSRTEDSAQTMEFEISK
ncbi:MAG TPA: DUF995 domain-containing protein [Casimicrobiaceae bacterium]|nr:DUF995 domain-containing protein [Casimicrobiaceae bacterium]